MNKSEYLNQLKKELSGLSHSDIEDILRDQEEYFREAINSGRDETQVIQSMGSPVQLAKELKAEFQIKAATDEKKVIPKTKNIFKAILALCVLAPFNLIFVLGPFLGLCGALLAAWAVDAAFVLVALAVMGVSIVGLSVVNPVMALTLFFGGFTALGISILLLCATFFVTGWFLKMTAAFLKWNIQFIQNQAQ